MLKQTLQVLAARAQASNCARYMQAHNAIVAANSKQQLSNDEIVALVQTELNITIFDDLFNDIQTMCDNDYIPQQYVYAYSKKF